MRKRHFEGTGAEVSVLGVGCMGMSEFYGPRDEAEALATVHAALHRGVTLLDTADMYGYGANEELLGRALRGRRSGVMIGTKFGIVRSRDPGVRTRRDGSPGYVRKACEASLQRLGVEVIDIYYLHRVDPKTPIEETVGALAELVRAGKIRYVGLSEVLPSTLRRAHAIYPISFVQTEYSLWSREPEAELIPTCRELGVGLVAYSPLGRGLLTGAIRSPDALHVTDSRRGWPRFQEENLARNLAQLRALESAAGRLGCSPAQLALGWVLNNPQVVALPGISRRTHLEENLSSVTLEVPAGEFEQLADAFATGAAAGDRYPPEVLKTLEG